MLEAISRGVTIEGAARSPLTPRILRHVTASPPSAHPTSGWSRLFGEARVASPHTAEPSYLIALLSRDANIGQSRKGGVGPQGHPGIGVLRRKR